MPFLGVHFRVLLFYIQSVYCCTFQGFTVSCFSAISVFYWSTFKVFYCCTFQCFTGLHSKCFTVVHFSVLLLSVSVPYLDVHFRVYCCTFWCFTVGCCSAAQLHPHPAQVHRARLQGDCPCLPPAGVQDHLAPSTAHFKVWPDSNNNNHRNNKIIKFL